MENVTIRTGAPISLIAPSDIKPDKLTLRDLALLDRLAKVTEVILYIIVRKVHIKLRYTYDNTARQNMLIINTYRAFLISFIEKF